MVNVSALCVSIALLVWAIGLWIDPHPGAGLTFVMIAVWAVIEWHIETGRILP